METVIDGLNIHYICVGEGQPLVLLHGWGANIQVYSSIIDLVRTHYRVIALDMPGTGGSDEPPEAWDVDHYAAFVLKFLEGFDLDRVILMGHSFGCRVIIKLLNRKDLPFSVDKVIIVDGAGIKSVPSLKKRMRTRVFKAGRRICSLPAVRKAVPDALERLRKHFGSADYAGATPVMRQTLVKVVNEDLSPLLSGVTPEVLLIWGEHDTATPLSDGRKMEDLMPDAGLAVIQNAGHFPFLDQPYVFGRILSSYLHLE